MKLNKILKRKEVKITSLSAAIYLGLIFMTQGVFDISSSLAYIFIALVVSKVFMNTKKKDLKFYFLVGMGINILYNALFGFIHEINFSIILAGLEQGLVTLAVANLWGVKK